jgi:IclR helix-turn-helix domain
LFTPSRHDHDCRCVTLAGSAPYGRDPDDVPAFVSPVSGPGASGARFAFTSQRIAMIDSGIKIELTRAQLDRILRGGADAEGISQRLRGLAEKTSTSEFKELSQSPRLSRSLVLGLLVLAAFPLDGDALAVTDVAASLQMSPSTTHRYLTTLLAVGLLEQDPRTRRYRVPVSS